LFEVRAIRKILCFVEMQRLIIMMMMIIIIIIIIIINLEEA